MKRILLFLLLGMAALPSLMPAGSHAAGPPNVVMIISDDQGWTDFGFAGHPVVRTPHLDALAAESALFPNAYVPTSLCRASLATLLTGQYAHQHKICCNDPPAGVDRALMLPFLKNSPTVPRLLQSKGYVSLQTGKFWEGHFTNGGFTHGMTKTGRHGEEGLEIGRRTMQPVYDFIEAAGSRPFFAWYAPMMPHEPHTPPERLLKKYEAPGRADRLAKYWAMVEWFDETVGELLAYLDRKGLRDNTMVLFVVDNGWIQESGPRPTTRGWFGPKSKLSPYDGGLRTPVMIRWPGRTKAGRYDDLVSTIDLAPTMLKACGLAPPPEMQGLDLMPRASGGPALSRDSVYGTIYYHTAIDLDRPALNVTHRWVRRGKWKLIWPHEKSEKPELYDLKSDPMEETNLAPAHPDLVRQLHQQLDRWWSGRFPD